MLQANVIMFWPIYQNFPEGEINVIYFLIKGPKIVNFSLVVFVYIGLDSYYLMSVNMYSNVLY